MFRSVVARPWGVGCVVLGLLGGCASPSATAAQPEAPGPSSAAASPAVAGQPDAPLSEGASQGGTRDARPPATIYRSEIDHALARGPGYLLYELGPEPFRASGRFVGWEITRVFPEEPGLCAPGCDLQVGDVILSVNGDRLETPQALSNMIDALPSMDTLVIKSLRDQRRRVASYALRDG